MRKSILIGLCLILCALPVLSGAESVQGGPILTGKIEAKDTVTVYAPFGGTAKDFTLRAGDRVSKGTALLTLGTNKVYAPCDGIIRGVFPQVGDSAAFVQGRYGALCYIEPENQFVIQSNTAQGYDTPENRVLHIGEEVYLRATNNATKEGIGIITMVSGDQYTVEIISGSLEMRDGATIFRSPNYEMESRIGRGTVTRTDPVAVTADGSILTIAARDGETVQRGDPLFETVNGTLDGMSFASATIRAPQDGIVASVSVSPGQSVGKNQAVVTLYRMDTFQLVSSVSELDAQIVKEGDIVRISFDSLPGKSYEGTITSVSGIGTLSDNYTDYAVYIDFTPDELVRIGMSATGYLVQ